MTSIARMKCLKYDCLTEFLDTHDIVICGLICSRFGLLGQLKKLSPEVIQNAATKLVNIYKDDLDQCFGVELIQFAEFSKIFKEEEGDGIGREHFRYKLILDKTVKGAFPNVEIALRIYIYIVLITAAMKKTILVSPFARS